jgi:hypothetical protein
MRRANKKGSKMKELTRAQLRKAFVKTEAKVKKPTQQQQDMQSMITGINRLDARYLSLSNQTASFGAVVKSAVDTIVAGSAHDRKSITEVVAVLSTDVVRLEGAIRELTSLINRNERGLNNYAHIGDLNHIRKTHQVLAKAVVPLLKNGSTDRKERKKIKGIARDG